MAELLHFKNAYALIHHTKYFTNMPFLKENLQNQHYNWSSPGNVSTFTGTPSRRLFDRENGNQVLFIINFYESVAEKFSVTEGHKLEELINNELPMEAKSEISVFNWLKVATVLC
jgi:hypothetical protein